MQAETLVLQIRRWSTMLWTSLIVLGYLLIWHRALTLANLNWPTKLIVGGIFSAVYLLIVRGLIWFGRKMISRSLGKCSGS